LELFPEVVAEEAERVAMELAHPQLADDLVLWAESPEEARNFLARADRAGAKWVPDQIFVAKRSGKVRHNRYVGGEFYRTTNDAAVDVYDEVVLAPEGIIDLVQWCTCDIMLSRGDRPMVVVEDTTHIVRMNLYQRIPRIARAAMLGVPSVVLQGTRGLNFQLRGDRWGLHRYLRAYEGMARLYKGCAPVPLYYLDEEAAERKAESEMIRYVDAVLARDGDAVRAVREQALTSLMDTLAVEGDELPPQINSIAVRDAEVVVRIGAKPDVKSWHQKGSGQMDPYVGMILAAKLIYCYNDQGTQTKPLVVEFTYLPAGFWFFKDAEQATALYKRLPYEFADEVRFLG
jgi:hypothetical protein